MAPWSFGTAPISFLFGPAALALNFGAARVASAGWTSLRVEIQDGQMQFTFAGLHLASDLLPGLPLEGDATLVFKDGKFSPSPASSISLRQPVAVNARLTSAGMSRIALEWTAGDTAGVALPGLQVALPASAALSLVLEASPPPDGVPRVSLQLNASVDQVVTATSGFAWMRGLDREIHAKAGQAAQALFNFTSKARQTASLTLVQFELGTNGPADVPSAV